MLKKLLCGVAALSCSYSSLSGVEVEFGQLNWLDEAGNVMIFASQVGEATFHFDPGDPFDQQLLVWGGGYLNLLVAATPDGPFEWAVQNLYLCIPDDVYMVGSSPSVQFRVPVPDGEQWIESFFDVFLTIEPLVDPPMPVPRPAPVTLYDYHVGGFFGGGSGLSILPLVIGPWVGPGPLLFPPAEVGRTWLPGEFLAPIDEGTNGCAPASCARSIEYMGFVHGFPTDPGQGIYGGLYGEMGTTSNGGTSDPNMLAGKRRYTAAQHLPICSELVYGFSDWLSFMLWGLQQGADVEILISWTGGGGHAAMITGIVIFPDGSAIISYVDDPTQGDGQAENKEHVIYVKPDGTFQGGRVDGFMIEVTCDPVPGDTDGDGDVDQSDLGSLLSAYGSTVGDPDYNPAADFDEDGDVDQSDLGTLLSNYGVGT